MPCEIADFRISWKKAGVVACVCLYGSSVFLGIGDAPEAVLLCLTWLIFLVSGARSSTIAAFIQGRGIREILSTRRSFWMHGAILATITTVAAVFLFGFEQKWLIIVGISLHLSYVFGKLSCLDAGCCGWLKNEGNLSPIKAIPLQALEALAALIATIIAALLFPLFNSATVLGVCVVTHGTLRIWTTHLRKTSSFSEFLMVGIGLTILGFA
jgi:hypothetical protein